MSPEWTFKSKAEEFKVLYYTYPSDNPYLQDKFKINIEKIGDIVGAKKSALEHIRTLNPSSPEQPLISALPEIKMDYLLPLDCEEFTAGEYANNISLVLVIEVLERKVLFMGDMLKSGTEKFLRKSKYVNDDIKSILAEGINYFVVPHHGLQTSFSIELFKWMDRVDLNIISEKIRREESDEPRSDVDTRYYDREFSTGNNTLKKNGVKTSLGHIVIDLDENKVQQFKDIRDVLNLFS